MQIEFPIEFIVHGTPVSQQARRAASREEWKERVRQASSGVLPSPHFAFEGAMSVTLYYLPPEVMEGDIDNIKPVLDALSRLVYIDDRQVERIVAQKFDPMRQVEFGRQTDLFRKAVEGARPALYIRVSSDPTEDFVE